MFRKFLNCLGIFLYLSASSISSADNLLPEIELSADETLVEIPATSEDQLIIRGLTYDFYSQQLISSRNIDQIKQLVGNTFDNKIEYYQAEPLKEQLTFILHEIGYPDAKVHLEQRDGRERFVADLKGSYLKPEQVDYYSINKGLKSALEEKNITAAGATLRNQETLKKQREENKAAASEKMQPFMATEFDITHKKDGEVVLPDIEDVKLPLINIEIPENEKAQEQIVASLQEAQNRAEEEEQQELIAEVKEAANLGIGLTQSEDKKSYLTGIVNSKVDHYINSGLNSIYGVNAQISLGLSIQDHIAPKGKILVPLYNTPQNIIFAQTGLTHASGDRDIAHAGFGWRYFPDATSYEDVGDYMIGTNMVFDYDLHRRHKRMSLGLEYANRHMFIASNYYHRLSNWTGSFDFEKDYVQERPANGFDLKTKFFLPHKTGYGALAATADVTHWMGKDIAPFGSTKNPNDLEDNPWIFGFGLSYQPFPALSFKVSHQVTANGHNNELFEMNFNLPLGDYDLKDAFNPDALGQGSGFDLISMRKAFIERDYNMPLQYRATPGKYHIDFCGYSGDKNQKLCFFVYDGLKRPVSGKTATITAKDPCVVFDQNGSYTTDSSGHFYATILESCTSKTTVTVDVEGNKKSFEIEIKNLTLTVKANPERIQRFETSTITLSGKSAASAGIPISWTLQGPGSLSDGQTKLDETGKATVIYHPDTTVPATQNVTVIGTVYDNKFAAPVEVYVYGTGGIEFGEGLSEAADVIEGTEIRTVSYKDLRPGSTVTISIEGDGKLSENEDGSDPKTSVDLVVDENGTVNLFVVADNVDNGTITITGTTEDPYAVPAVGVLAVKSYVADISLSTNFAENGDPFTVNISGLKKGTEVSWTNSSFATPVSNTSSVDENGNTSMEYTVLDDKWNGTINDISITYYRNVNNTTTDPVQSLDIKEYTPVWSITAANQDKLNWFSGDDSFVATLTGGKPNRSVTVSNSQDNVTLTVPAVFDSNGNADVTITGKDVRSADAFSITSSANGKTQSLADVVTNNVLTYHVYEPVIHTSQGVCGENITDTALVSGAPAFKSQANTIDYKTDYEIEFSGLLRNSPVTFSCNNSGLSASSGTTDSEGKVKVTVYGVSDYAIKNLTISVGYQVNSVESSATTKEFTLSLYQYTLSISSSTDTIVADGTAVVTVTGGRANEAVDWSLTGNGQYTAQDATFDSTGTAKATVQGVSPFTSSINIDSKNNFLNTKLSKKIRIINSKSYYKAYDICFGCSGPYQEHLSLSSIISDPSTITSINVTMSGDNYCSLMVDGSWLFTGVANTLDASGAHQCVGYSTNITNRSFNNGSYLFFSVDDDGEETVALGYTVNISYTTK